MKKVTKWLFYNKYDVSSLIALVIALVFIQLNEISLENKWLLIPYTILLWVGMVLIIVLSQFILKDRNVEISRSYVIAAILIVLVLSTTIKIAMH